MRSPGRNRSVPKEIDPPEEADLDDIAEEVVYVGSQEHKTSPSFAGSPRPRPDASICPSRLNDQQDKLTDWLKDAIRRGAVVATLEGGYPRYAWYKEGETVYLARLVNRGRGTYKGFPIEKNEWPNGIQEVYE